MKKIAAAFIGCFAAFSHAEEIPRWGNALSAEEVAYFDEMLRVEPAIDAMTPHYEISSEWLLSQPAAVDVGSRYALSIVEVAYAPHHSDIIYGFAETQINDNLAIFVQVSQTDQHSPQSREYIGTGITFHNHWRAGEGIGLGVAHGRAKEHQPYPDWESAEMAWELSYFGHLLNRLDAQTSVYYIQHPTQNVEVGDSIAAQLRVNFKF